MRARVSDVPDETTAVSWPSFFISRLVGSIVDSMNRRHEGTDAGCVDPSGKKRLVNRMAPSLKLRAKSSSVWSKTTTSVEPPPMSMRIERWSARGSACKTPK